MRRLARIDAEKEQVLRQALACGGVAFLLRAQLRQKARAQALAIDVGREETVRLRLEVARGQPPQGGAVRMGGAGREAGADRRQALECVGRAAAHEPEQVAFEVGHRGGIDRARRDVGLDRDRAPLPVLRPQVGGVDALGAHQLLDGAVLREQGHRRHRSAAQSAREQVEQGERRALDRLDRGDVELVRLGDVALHQRLARAQQHRTGREPDQIEHAHALMEVLARRAQHGRLDIVEVGVEGRFGFPQGPPQRLVRAVEHLAQLFLDPGEGADVGLGIGLAGVHALPRCVPVCGPAYRPASRAPVN